MLPAGCKIQPFVSRDDKIHAISDQGDTECHEGNANDFVVPGMRSENATGLVCRAAHDGYLKRMVDPLAKPDKEAGRRNCSRRSNGECLQYSGPGEQKNRDTNNHENLIPVIKSKLGEWVRDFHRGSMRR
jgi:hypothetical protein